MQLVKRLHQQVGKLVKSLTRKPIQQKKGCVFSILLLPDAEGFFICFYMEREGTPSPAAFKSLHNSHKHVIDKSAQYLTACCQPAT